MAQDSANKATYISPIAVDLGAANTGVYFAHYKADSPLEVLKGDEAKKGKVYKLDKDSFTYLMEERTAARHQRRGYDRRQMAKRLFKLIWCKHFNLDWDPEIQQAIGFLMNRRGFSFLTEEYNAEKLREFPQEAYEQLPDVLKRVADENQNEDGSYDLSSPLIEWVNEGEEKVKEIFEKLNEQRKEIKRELVVISCTEALQKYCKVRVEEGGVIKKAKKDKLSHLSPWIATEWINRGIPLPSADIPDMDMVAYLNDEKNIEVVRAIASQLDGTMPQMQDKKSELRKSVWNFKKIDILTADFEAESVFISNHLQNFHVAVEKSLNELESGGRHRSKYFAEVRAVLSENESHSHGYLQQFCAALKGGEFSGLDVDSLTRLIGHISNLELKPLRKYFNDTKHQKADYWDEDRISKLFARWILREWRVDAEKDKGKRSGAPGDYVKLRKLWAASPKKAVDFWLNTCPIYTVPPYQDNNNRQPPKCQSLVFNTKFLDKKYAGWRDWLKQLQATGEVSDYLDDYTDDLQKLESGSNKSYFVEDAAYRGKLLTDSGRRSMAELDARILHFIFDRVKDEDVLQLNEIYSRTKSIRQNVRKKDAESQKRVDEAKNKLQEAHAVSCLPKELKTKPDYSSDDIFPEGSFLHLVCSYYKFRQRARDGRIYIHPQYRYLKGRGYQNTGRFDDRAHLLTYCNHKPRQKRYQMLGDVAGLLQVSPDALSKYVKDLAGKSIDEQIFSWLEHEKSLVSNCARAAQEQKERRGRLKLDIRSAWYEIKGLSTDKEIKKVLKDSRVRDAYKLYSFCLRAIGLCSNLTDGLYDEQQQQKWKQELEKNPATAVYLLAQLHNIVFESRSGNASTCAVCSTDNAHRMKQVPVRVARGGEDTTAKAQRVPAIPMRIIDGAVMRMARIVGGAIANDKWEQIEEGLKAGTQICVPIVTESNRFEFEPSLRTILKQKKDKKLSELENQRAIPERLLDDKDERIKAAGKGICPYTGAPVGSNGELDHIIPRAGKRGVLNDEANLIYASETGNKSKGKTEYGLSDLNQTYKEQMFPGCSNDTRIKTWIEEQIGDGEGEYFKFGRYISFINLDTDQKIAFRHALFLKDEPIREKVIRAIDNRNRALVNGTQRYFAEVVANALHRKAKDIRKEHLLSFDFFGVESKPNPQGDSTSDLRKMYESEEEQKKPSNSLIFEYQKKQGEAQDSYSHLIDAQIAFVIAADAHRNDGAFKLRIDDGVRREYYDKEGEFHLAKSMFGIIMVSPDDYEPEGIQRRSFYDVETDHRKLIGSGEGEQVRIGYQIHNDNFIAEKFFPLLELEDGEIRKGFSLQPERSVEYKKKDFDKLRESDFLCRSKTKKNIWLVRRKKASKHLMDAGRYQLSNDEVKVAKLLDGLVYVTQRQTVQKALTKRPRPEPETVIEALDNWDECITKENFEIKGIVLPAFDVWENLKKELEQARDKGEDDLDKALRKCHLFKDEHDGSIANHNKKKKVFSLPIKKVGMGSIRIQRKSWNGQKIIQVASEESFARYGDNRPHTIHSKNSIPKGIYTGMPNNLSPERREWKEIPREFLDDYNRDSEVQIESAKVILQSSKHVNITIYLNNPQGVSLPHLESGEWQGKICVYTDSKKLQETQEKKKDTHHHILKAEWFKNPFDLPDERNNIKLKRLSSGLYEVQFKILRRAPVKKWLTVVKD